MGMAGTEAKTPSWARTVGVAAAACLIYALSCGIRSNYGVLLSPIAETTGLAVETVSFVVAVAQLVFGIMQPVFGFVALRTGGVLVLRVGAVLMAAGLVAIPFCRSLWMLMAALGLALPAGTAALSYGLIMGLITPQLPRRVVPGVSGLVNASSGIGGTLLSLALQALVTGVGLLGAMVFVAVPTLLLLPLTFVLARSARGEGGGPGEPAPRQEDAAGDAAAGEAGAAGAEAVAPAPALGSLLRAAVHEPDYLLLLAGFFTCGFHMAIIETHLYTQITVLGFTGSTAALAFSVYGVATMAGSVASGLLCGRMPMGRVLAGLYGARMAIVLAFLAAPKSLATVFAFAILLGLTGSATVPPTSGLTERLFGAASLATLFGIVFLSHQVGSFFSAWLGGVCLSATGGYALIWLVDAAFCAVAAILSSRIRTR